MTEYEEYQTAEKQAMERTLELLSKGLSRESKEELDYAGIATYLHNLYGGVENILKHTLKNCGVRITPSETWHKELLIGAVKHRIVSESLADQLRDYLKFRHFFIHGYGFMLEPELLMPLAEKARLVFGQFFEEIKLYISKPRKE
ncbi:hypothetical protein KKB84_02610 [bacterium]|nr:hypothetical protein [bacterium]MBU1152847.1 hypothetical protein [bacterium]MBU2600476.1 hypothetical protein [bacterium]